jgi:hypothetical protein
VGALLTIIYLVIFVALFFGFGVDLYQRKKPKVSFNQETGAYKKASISNKNFTYAYRVEDTFGYQVEDESVIYQETTVFQFEMEKGNWALKGYKIMPNKKCGEFPEFKEKEAKFNISMGNWYCLDAENLTMGGQWDGNFIYGVQINTRQCTTQSGRNCSSQEKMKTAFINNITSSNFFYSDLTLKVLPSMDDFEAPLKSSLINHYDMLHIGVTKRKVTTFKTTSIVNDIGWFFNDIIEDSIYTVDTISPDFSLKLPWEQDILFTQFLYFGKNFEVYNRSYTKIQEVFATIGGFSKSFYFAIFLIYNLSYSCYKNLLLISHVPISDSEVGYSPVKRARDLILKKNTCYFGKDKLEILDKIEKCEKYDKYEKYEKCEKIDENEVATPSDTTTIRNLQNCRTGPNTSPTKNHHYPQNSNNFGNYNNNNILPIGPTKPSDNTARSNFNRRNQAEKLPLPNISFSDYIFKKFFNCNSKNGRVRTALNKYSVYQSYFQNCFDVFSYVNMYREFNEMKNILIEDIQRIDTVEKTDKNVKAKTNFNKAAERRLSFTNSPYRRKSVTIDLERRRSIFSLASMRKI